MVNQFLLIFQEVNLQIHLIVWFNVFVFSIILYYQLYNFQKSYEELRLANNLIIIHAEISFIVSVTSHILTFSLHFDIISNKKIAIASLHYFKTSCEKSSIFYFAFSETKTLMCFLLDLQSVS